MERRQCCRCNQKWHLCKKQWIVRNRTCATLRAFLLGDKYEHFQELNISRAEKSEINTSMEVRWIMQGAWILTKSEVISRTRHDLFISHDDPHRADDVHGPSSGIWNCFFFLFLFNWRLHTGLHWGHHDCCCLKVYLLIHLWVMKRMSAGRPR